MINPLDLLVILREPRQILHDKSPDDLNIQHRRDTDGRFGPQYWQHQTRKVVSPHVCWFLFIPFTDKYNIEYTYNICIHIIVNIMYICAYELYIHMYT